MKLTPAVLIALGVATVSYHCQSSAAVEGESFTAAETKRCSALEGTRMGSARIDNAETINRGTPLIGFWRRLFIKTFIFHDLPPLDAPDSFCKVTVKLHPIPGSEITAQLWLPKQWNGKFLGTGGGGINGGLTGAPLTLRAPLQKGYAAMATDAGHADTDSAEFAYKSREQFLDFAYRANHVAADFAKTLLASYYGTHARHSYFLGCSNGGRDALMEAWRFPDDYEAIVAGAPAAGWSKLMAASGWITQASQSAPKLGDKMTLVQNAVIGKCDALDGVKDNLIENPLECHFDPAELQCQSGDGADCLSKNEVDALRKIYAGPHLKDGTLVYPGITPGGEALPHNWSLWVLGGEKSMMAKLGSTATRWMVYGDPKWGIQDFNVDSTYALAKERIASIMDSDNPDLSGFMRKKGKLLLYQGWNDPAITAKATLNYYAALQNTLGEAAERQVRLFMVPGMGHCGGGDCPNDFDMLDAMDHWVESGTAPERITATQYDPPALLGPLPGAKVIRTRPLCAWPQVARYRGAGSTDDAINFSCQ